MQNNFALRPALPADAPAIAKVHVDSWRTTYAGIVAPEVLARLSYEQREQVWANMLAAPTNNSCTYVAQTPAGAVVGFVNAGPEREGDPTYTGEIYALYLLHQYQRQGLGRQLGQAAAKALHQHGHNTLLIWVLAANPARHFYAALGGQPVREKNIEIGGQTLVEVAYGWADISRLLQTRHIYSVFEKTQGCTRLRYS